MDATSITRFARRRSPASRRTRSRRETRRRSRFSAPACRRHAHLEAMCAVRPHQTRQRLEPQRASMRRSSPRLRASDFGVDANAVADRDRTRATTPTSSAPTTSSERAGAATASGCRRARTSTPSARRSTHAREIDSATVVRSRLYVDRRESALKEPGDILVPLKNGEIGARPHRRRDRRSGRSATAPGRRDRRRDHAVQVARPRDRRSRVRQIRLRGSEAAGRRRGSRARGHAPLAGH